MSTTTETKEWGLRHSNGYIRWCRTRGEAEDMKSGRRIEGRVGAWRNHDLVYRVITTTVGDPTPADEEPESVDLVGALRRSVEAARQRRLNGGER